MKISTKGRYGVRFLMDLAANSEAGNVTLKEVAQRQGISEKYLWQIVSPLKKQGLIHSVSGPGGGYTLAKSPAEITLRDILAVLEGDDGLVACISDPGSCARGNACAAREMWKDVGERIDEVLASVVLIDLVERQRVIRESEASSYTI